MPLFKKPQVPLPPPLPPLPGSYVNSKPAETKPSQTVAAVVIPSQNGIDSSTSYSSTENTNDSKSDIREQVENTPNPERVENSGNTAKSDDLTYNHEVTEDSKTESNAKGKDQTEKKTKPKPPSKSKRLQKALSSGSLTLPSLRLGGKRSKKKDNERLSIIETSEQSITEDADSGGGELREATLWKLPGMDSAPRKDRRSSSPAMSRENREKSQSKKNDSASSLIKSNKELPQLAQQEEHIPSFSKETLGRSKTVLDSEVDMRKRELPPLPPEEMETRPIALSTSISEQNKEATGPISIEKNSEEVLIESNECNLNESADSGKQDSIVLSLSAWPSNVTPESSRKVSQVTHSNMTLGDVPQRYAGCYPLRFRVLQGYCSDSTDVNISTDDVYDIHLVKETKVVSVRSDNGMLHRFPLGSPQKVGIIYNPTNDYEKGLDGHMFRTVADITAAQVLPKVVCATQEARNLDGKYLVEENEILVIRQVHRTLFKGKKGLKVISMLSRTEKTLPEDCAGYFSTKPSLVRLHLPEIIEYISKPFPLHVVMYSAGENLSSSDQPGAVTGVVTMTEYSAEASLVVSAVPFDENQELVPLDHLDHESSELFDIPLDEDIRELEVAVVQVSQKPEIEVASDRAESTHTCEETMNVSHNDLHSLSSSSDHVYDDTINVVRSQDFVINTSSGHLHDSQTMLNASGYSDVGKSASMQFVDADHSTAREYADEDYLAGYDTVGLHLLNPKWGQPTCRSSGYEHVHSSSEDVFHGGEPRLTSWMEDLQTATKGIENRLISLEKEKVSAETTKMQDMLTQLTKKLESVDSQLQTISARSENRPSNQGETDEEVANKQPTTNNQEKNRAYLSSLTLEEVCALLDAINLSQYKDPIERELVTGDILMEFDEEVLKEELGMTSKIHRIRLMKVISGQHSAEAILKK